MRSADRPRLVCRCLGVASPRIHAAVRADALASVAEVTKAVRAGGACGLCHPEIEEILAVERGDALDPGVVIENQAVCREETLARIEASLRGLLGPRLATAGVRVELLAVDGLRVRVRLGGATGDTAARLVAETLRKVVCSDLEVHVEA